MPPVSMDDLELVSAYNEGNDKAGQLLFIKHHKLILKIIFDVTKGHYYDDDCLQAGAVGLCTACRRFKPEVGVAFTTYAYYWIRKYVIMEVCNDILPAGGIVFGRDLKDKMFKYIGLKMTGYSNSVIAEKMKISVEEVEDISLVAVQASKPVSISNVSPQESDDQTELEIYGIPSTPSAESIVVQELEDQEYTEHVEALIRGIEDENERYILNHTLSLNGCVPLSRSDMLKELKMSAKQLADLRRTAYRNLKLLLRPGYTD